MGRLRCPMCQVQLCNTPNSIAKMGVRGLDAADLERVAEAVPLAGVRNLGVQVQRDVQNLLAKAWPDTGSPNSNRIS